MILAIIIFLAGTCLLCASALCIWRTIELGDLLALFPATVYGLSALICFIVALQPVVPLADSWQVLSDQVDECTASEYFTREECILIVAGGK